MPNQWREKSATTRMVLYCVSVPGAINKLLEHFRHLPLQKTSMACTLDLKDRTELEQTDAVKSHNPVKQIWAFLPKPLVQDHQHGSHLEVDSTIFLGGGAQL